jgi:NADH-quinone oxidoreductase subunit N
VLIIVGVGFKLALVPFHMWVADVYQGAGVPITASIATISKIAVFAMIYRLFAGIDLGSHTVVTWILTGIAVLSMLGGNWLGLRQTNVKRMLAYSSTAHLGYLMLPFLAGGTKGAAAAAFYLLAYSATSLGLFGTMSVLSNTDGDAETFDSYRGLAWRRPGLAIVMITMLLSIAGIPLTVGFMGKIYLLTAGVGSSLWLLAIVLVASSGIGLFYYLRLVAVQFSRQGEADATRPAAGFPAALVLVVLTAAVIGLGIYPTPLLSAIGSIVPSL